MTVAADGVTVVVPAWNAAATLPACLAAIAALDHPVAEVIVFDDGSTDTTAAIARAAGARLIQHGGPPAGPAHGRNVAAAAARTPLLLFVDADVIVAPDALRLLVADMRAHGAVAAFGSYDDRPRSRRAASLYANLRHHFIHQHGHRDAGTFWSGLGLVGRDAFRAAGGFDAARFRAPSIEDIELGARLRRAGHGIRSVPEAQGTHWKDWTLWRVWHTDVVRRARPWARLIVEERLPQLDLNVAPAERVKAALALALPVLALIAVVAPRSGLPAVVIAVAAYAWANRALFRFFARRLPLPALLQAVAMHWCYHVYAALTFGLVLLHAALAGRVPGPRPAAEARRTSV